MIKDSVPTLKIDFQFWYTILYHPVADRNTVVALASAGISVELASWGLARLTERLIDSLIIT